MAHDSQRHHQGMLDDPASFRELWSGTDSALDGDELIAIGGSVFVEGMWGGWALFTDAITPRRFVVIHRAVSRVLEQFDQKTFVHLDPDNPQAARWSKLLGFKTLWLEFLPDGRKMLRAEADVRIS